MKTSIFVPKKIHVGFQERSNTYTGKLAYIIYEDEKGKLRKEVSWNGWRDKKINPQIEDNVPTSGFVLNKKVGDHVSYWNHRQAYVRVYDPRDFEFEITIENLLFILENTSSIKGKGLEGEFVYGWDGKELVLVPVDSPDYKEIEEYSKAMFRAINIKAKDLIVGATYKNNKNEELVYMGRFECWTGTYIGCGKKEWSNKDKNGKIDRRYVFHRPNTKYSWEKFVTYKSIPNSIIGVVDEQCHGEYAQFYNKMENECFYSPVDEGKFIHEDYTHKEWAAIDTHWSCGHLFFSNEEQYHIYTIQETIIVLQGGRRWIGSVEQGIEHGGIIYDSMEQVFNTYKPQHRYAVLVNGNKYEEVTH